DRRPPPEPGKSDQGIAGPPTPLPTPPPQPQTKGPHRRDQGIHRSQTPGLRCQTTAPAATRRRPQRGQRTRSAIGKMQSRKHEKDNASVFFVFSAFVFS